MQLFTQNLGNPGTDSGIIVDKAILPIDTRIKSRTKIVLESGKEAGWVLPRGGLVRGGDLLACEEGDRILIIAAGEQVSTVNSTDSFSLMKAAWHLGNRHVPLELAPGFIRYAHDRILDDMVTGFGLAVIVEMQPFEPEAGAYQQQSHHHHA